MTFGAIRFAIAPYAGYTLTARNADALAQVQIDDAARAEIGDALAAGKAVTVHERPITVSGWAGSGYIVADPDTGAGAYKISGGANGGVLMILPSWAYGGVLIILGIVLLSLVIFSPYLAPELAEFFMGYNGLGFLLTMASAGLGFILIGISKIAPDAKDSNRLCNLGFNMILGFLGLFFGGIFNSFGSYINVELAESVCE